MEKYILVSFIFHEFANHFLAVNRDSRFLIKVNWIANDSNFHIRYIRTGVIL